jgi:hypothetical protein
MMARTDQTAGFSIKGASAAQAWPGPKIRMIITGVGGFSRGTAKGRKFFFFFFLMRGKRDKRSEKKTRRRKE